MNANKGKGLSSYDSCGELAREMAFKYLLLEKTFAVPQLSQIIREQLNGEVSRVSPYPTIEF